MLIGSGEQVPLLLRTETKKGVSNVGAGKSTGKRGEKKRFYLANQNQLSLSDPEEKGESKEGGAGSPKAQREKC